jgi:hypothetical protein
MAAAQALTSQLDIESIPALIDRAARDLMNARDAGEVLEARDKASFAYDAAKKAARLARAKQAHDDLIIAAHRAQARALEIESQAKMRLADEYDAAQERGEVARRGQRNDFLDVSEKVPTAPDLGLRHDQIHEARQIRDAESANPGLIKQTLQERLDAGEEPTKAHLRDVVTKAAIEALSGRRLQPRTSNKNPIHEPDPAFDAIAGVSGSCRRIMEFVAQFGPEKILDGCVDDAMRARSIAEIRECRDVLNRVLELSNA